MGGHTQFEEFITLAQATQAWHEARELYEGYYNLYLRYATITYEDKDKKFKLAMRFEK